MKYKGFIIYPSGLVSYNERSRKYQKHYCIIAPGHYQSEYPMSSLGIADAKQIIDNYLLSNKPDNK